jgi:AraC-like DNA-binding protein
MDTKDIPRWELNGFRVMHRTNDPVTPFGYNHLEKALHIPGFEIYSSEGLIGSMGPLKSAFYRMSITVQGSLDMQIGLEHFKHKPNTLAFTYPNQIIYKNNISADAFGYYVLFEEDFLTDLIPSVRIPFEFPFFDPGGQPHFQIEPQEMDSIVEHALHIDQELQQLRSGRMKAIQMHLYLMLLEAKRSYERQGLHPVYDMQDSASMVRRFRKLIAQRYMELRQVSAYADLLAVTPNHLNRVVKQVTGETASHMIQEMLLEEAKNLLKYTNQTVAEIAYKLDFGDPGTFGRFFKKTSGGLTPLEYRAAQV